MSIHKDDENDDGSETQTSIIKVPLDSVGCIIGKGGTQIRIIRKESGANVQVDELIEDRNDRDVVFKGTKEQVSIALKMVQDLCASFEKQKLDSEAEL